MSYTLLDHQKAIILNICKDKQLFKKELIKSMEWLNDQEQRVFKKWICENFMFEYPDVLNHVFGEKIQGHEKPLKRKRITSSSLEMA